jgi:LysR family transcriptional regulator, glycine cleavage system transcriptional activator
LRRPEDLARVTLLHDMVGDGWQGWLERQDAATFDHAQGPRFAHCDLVLAAAERGQGVALAYGALIAHELARGTLVRLFPAETEPVLIYSLACLDGRAETPKIAAFRRWILGEIRHEADEAKSAGNLHLASTA